MKPRLLLLMLKTENSKRIITAVLLVIIAVAAILFLESFLFAIAVGLIAAASAWEWCRLGVATVALDSNIAFILLIGAGVPALFIFPHSSALDYWHCPALVDNHYDSHRP